MREFVTTTSLFDATGHRKYLTAAERKAFLVAACKQEETVMTFCRVVAETGCRISEALNLTSDRIDLEAGTINFESLKKRRRGVYRAVPVSPDVLADLKRVHSLAPSTSKEVVPFKLWPWARMTAYRHVLTVMGAAKIKGPHATPKGLRHGFAIAALEAGVPINLVQRWMGHSSLATTAIYANAVGAEERRFASRLWDKRKGPGT